MSLFRFCRKVWPVAASLAFFAFLVYGAVRNWPTLAKVWQSDVGWKSLASEVHHKLPDKFNGKAAWIDGNGLLARLLGKRYVNATMKFRGGLLEDLNHPRREVAPLAKELAKWDKFVKSLGGRFLYVQAPVKLDRKLEVLPAGCNPALNNAWDGVDELMRRLDEAQVPHLDLSNGIADNFEQPTSTGPTTIGVTRRSLPSSRKWQKRLPSLRANPCRTICRSSKRRIGRKYRLAATFWARKGAEPAPCLPGATSSRTMCPSLPPTSI